MNIARLCSNRATPNGGDKKVKFFNGVRTGWVHAANSTRCAHLKSRVYKAQPATCETVGPVIWVKASKIKRPRSFMSMKKIELESMSADDLWSLHEQVSEILSARITSEKLELEKRLAVLGRGRDVIEGNGASPTHGANGKVRRKYPDVLPKYRNPQTSETWSGRGKQPRWLVAAIKTGGKIEDFEIGAVASSRGRRQRA